MSEYLAEIHPGFGLHLLEWITRICAASEARLLPQSSYLRVPPRRGPKKSIDMLLNSSSSDQDGVIITGILDAQKLTLLISAESEAAMWKVKSALTWMLAVLQPRPENAEGLFFLPLDQNSLERGIPKPTEFKPENLDQYCWMELFSYVVVVGIPPPAEVAVDITTEGLEIELDLLKELAAVDREATIKGGVKIMYGFDTAIVPLEPAEARRWHFMTTKGRQIKPRRAENELAEHKLDRILLASEYLTGKVHIGWCPNPVIRICNQALNSFANELIKPSGVLAVEMLEEQSERSSGKAFSFSQRAGFFGSSLGFSTGVKRETKYIRVVVIAARTRENSFEGILASAMGTPSIFWDSRNQRVSLLPVISVLAFASPRFIEWAKYNFQKEQNGKREKAGIYYSTDMNTGSSARTVLRQNSPLLVDTATGEPVSEPLTFKDITRNIWEKMCNGEDLCVNGQSGSNLNDDEYIFGYNLSEAMYQKRVQLRKLQRLTTMKSWIPICQGHRLQVIFSQYVGEVLSCQCNVADGLPAGKQPAKGTLTCLLDDLRSFYGAKWSTLAQDSSMNGLPIGEKFEWIPQGYVPGEGHSPCSRRIFQSITSITERETKKLQRRKNKMTCPSTTPQGRPVGVSTIHLPSDQRLICFG